MTTASRQPADGWALVAGGASGIGAATVRRLAGHGVHGVVLDRDPFPDDLAGWETHVVDLGDPQAIDDEIARLHDAFSAPRLLVNAAGVNGSASSAYDVDSHEWDRVHAINLRGAFLLARDVLAWMRDDGGGSIINVASQLATAVVRANPHYQVAKAGVLQVTRTLALEGAADGVSVNSVSPGIVTTPMTDRVMADPEWTRDRLARIPAGRFAHPEEVAEVIVAIGLLETSYLTGSEIVVDGGYLLQ